MAVLNRGEQPETVTLHFKEMGMKGKVKVRDIWKHVNLGTMETLTVSPKAHGTEVYKLTLKK